MKYPLKSFYILTILAMSFMSGFAQKQELPVGTTMSVSAPTTFGGQNAIVLVPISVNFGAFEVSDYQLDIVYDPAVITPSVTGPTGTTTACVSAGTLTGNAGLSVTCFVNPAGRLNVAVFSPGPTMTGSGTLLFIRFQVNTGVLPGATSPLQITDEAFFELSGPIPSTAVTSIDGSLTVLAPTSAGVVVSGQVVTSGGLPVRNARVYLSGVSGEPRVALTNPFGYFAFEDVPAGQSYVISTNAKGYSFVPILLDVGSEVTGLQIVAEP
ncbi:MAG: carboxypeptidase regulatory-like domain-containing protein [Pyrinomonadaceae bacterium]|nr:carboxypeptidase regulatory-like domain-containing protein [Pyrinomonadaceae bacterium]